MLYHPGESTIPEGELTLTDARTLRRWQRDYRPTPKSQAKLERDAAKHHARRVEQLALATSIVRSTIQGYRFAVVSVPPKPICPTRERGQSKQNYRKVQAAHQAAMQAWEERYG